MCKCFPKSLLFFSTHSLFNSWSRKLKVHRVNSQTISSYPVRFSTDTDNINNIHCTQKMKKFLLENFIFCAVILFLLFFFVFFVFVFSLICFVWNNIYIFWYTFGCAGWQVIQRLYPANFRKQDYFFCLIEYTKLQPRAKNFRKTLVFTLNSTLQEKFNFYFQEIFCWIWQHFLFGKKTGH